MDIFDTIEQDVLNSKLESQMKQLKSWKPFKIVYGYIDENKKIVTNYATTMSKPKNAAKKGHKVFIIK